MSKDPVRSLYECESQHGSYSKCTLPEGHAGQHKNSSYVWGSSAPVIKQPEIANARVASVVGTKDAEVPTV